MEHDTIPPIANDDPASAFAALRGEVSLLRRAVEGLAAERNDAPDYTATLGETARQLREIAKFMDAVAKSPAMRFTPENLASEIAKAGATARAGDRDNLDRASSTLKASIKSIDAVVQQAWTAERQNRWLVGTGIGGVMGGVLLWSILPGEIARALPASWNVPEKIAARVLRMDMVDAGKRLIAVDRSHRVSRQTKATAKKSNAPDFSDANARYLGTDTQAYGVYRRSHSINDLAHQPNRSPRMNLKLISAPPRGLS